jgi:cytochrome bd ubiquinol oxidase subunit II
MFQEVLPASNRAVDAITIGGASSQHNTLVVMTVVAAIFTPFVLVYQSWTYWVFRRRLTRPPAAAAGAGAPVAGAASTAPAGGGG